MSQFFNRNIGFHGQMARGVLGALSLIAGMAMADFKRWICLLLIGLGLFALFQAVHGWCFARACGLRVKQWRAARRLLRQT
jgi:hypothetical protein